MFCKYCGKEVDDKSKFCGNCGKDQGQEPSFGAPTSTPVPAVTINGQWQKKKSKGCLPVVIIFIALISIIVAIIVNNAGSTKLSPSELKAQGIEFDDRAWADFLILYENHHYFIDATEKYSKGQGSELDFYNYCKDLEDKFGELSLVFDYAKTDDQKTYLSTFQTFAIEDQLAAKNLMKYLDSDSNEDLSTAQDHIERAKQAAVTIAGNRGILLRKIGLTDSETKSKVDKAVSDMKAIDKK